MFIAVVWHAGVPDTQVADHHISSAADWLHWRTDSLPGSDSFLGHRGNRLAVSCERIRLAIFLRCFHLVEMARGCVRSQPKLCGSIGNAEVNERYVGDDVVGKLRMDVIVIFVNGLTHALGLRKCIVRCDPIEDGPFSQVPALLSVKIIPYVEGLTHAFAICKRKGLK